MNLMLEGKRALVTGSTSGIGEAVARRFAEEGAAVVIHGRNGEAAKRICDEITSAGGRAAHALGDLAEDASAQEVARKALAAFGGIDILVNNAGVYDRKPWPETEPAKWQRMFNNNILSMVRVTQAVLPQMRALGWGRVIQMGSVTGTTPMAVGADYGMTKAAQANFSVSLAKELAGTGITSNTVSPGPVPTEEFLGIMRAAAVSRGLAPDTPWSEIEKWATTVLSPTPTHRFTRPEEVANLVVFVASPLADQINGANLRIDGGQPGTVN